MKGGKHNGKEKRHDEDDQKAQTEESHVVLTGKLLSLEDLYETV